MTESEICVIQQRVEVMERHLSKWFEEIREKLGELYESRASQRAVMESMTALMEIYKNNTAVQINHVSADVRELRQVMDAWFDKADAKIKEVKSASDGRLDTLEKFQWRAAGIAFGVSSATAILISLIGLWLKLKP